MKTHLRPPHFLVDFRKRNSPPVASFAHAPEGVALETQSSDHRAERAFPQLFCAVPVSQLVVRATPSCIREQEWQYECKNSRMLCAGTLVAPSPSSLPPVRTTTERMLGRAKGVEGGIFERRRV